MEDRYKGYEEESSDSSLKNEINELRECITEDEGNKDEGTKIPKLNNSFINISRNKDSFVLLNMNINNLYSNNFDLDIKNDNSFNRNKDANKEKEFIPFLGESIFEPNHTINDIGKNLNIENNQPKIKRKNDNSKDMKRDEVSEINEAWQPGSELIRLEPILEIVKSICKIETSEGTASGFLIEFQPGDIINPIKFGGAV